MKDSKEKQIEEIVKLFMNIPARLFPEGFTYRPYVLAEALYNAGYRKQGEWISVAERLPEKNREVLAYRGDFRGDMMNTYTYLGSGNWEDDYGYRGSAEHEGITH